MPSSSAARPLPRASTIRSRLLLLVLGIVLPIGLAGAGAVYYIYESKQQQYQGSLMEATRALALVVDAEISKRETTARNLSVAPAVQRGDLREFYDYARQIAPGPETVVVLADPSGQQLFNTRRSFGDPLPKTVHSPSQLEAVRNGTVVTDLYMAPLGKQYSFAVSVPVQSKGKLAYFVSYAGYVAALQTVFESQRLPQNWTAAILDSSGVIVARNRDAQKFVGKPAVAQLREAVRSRPEGMLRTETITGGSVLAAFSRAPNYGWTLVIGVPESEVGSAAAAAAIAGGFAILVLLLSLVAAMHLGRRLVRPVEEVRNAAARMAAGSALQIRETGLAEIDAVLRVLAQASHQIAASNDEMKRRVQDALADAERAHQAVLHNQRLEALGQLTGGVAHDFNNLLMVVSNYAHLLKAKFAGVAGSKEIGGIERSVATGSKLTRQLLAFARRQPLRPEALTMHTRLPEIASLIRASLGSSIVVECEVADEHLQVVVDPAEFELALINLAVNARDAMPDGGRLRIAGERAEDGRVAVTVSDTGTGIPPDLLPRVFEPFFTTKAVGHGTGLGLSQVYGFARQASGEARIASEEGRGTKITLLLPAATADAITKSDAEVVPQRLGRSERVLLVEDNEELGQVTEQVLAGANYRVTRVLGADEAVRWLERAEYDVVLSDVRMPGQLDGLGLAEWIQQNRPGLPVVLTTGYTENLARARSMQVPVIPKPTAPDVLLAELQQALESGRSPKESTPTS